MNVATETLSAVPPQKFRHIFVSFALPLSA